MPQHLHRALSGPPTHARLAPPSPRSGLGSQLSKKKIFLRTIVGGTGPYAGAGGEVASRREEDGSYTHAFAMLLPTVRVTASDLLAAAAGN